MSSKPIPIQPRPGQREALLEIMKKRGDCSMQSLVREAIDLLIAREKRRK